MVSVDCISNFVLQSLKTIIWTYSRSVSASASTLRNESERRKQELFMTWLPRVRASMASRESYTPNRGTRRRQRCEKPSRLTRRRMLKLSSQRILKREPFLPTFWIEMK